MNGKERNEKETTKREQVSSSCGANVWKPRGTEGA